MIPPELKALDANLEAIARASLEPHLDALLDGTRGEQALVATRVAGAWIILATDRKAAAAELARWAQQVLEASSDVTLFDRFDSPITDSTGV